MNNTIFFRLDYINEPQIIHKDGVIRYIRCYGEAMTPHFKQGDILAVKTIPIECIVSGNIVFIETKKKHNLLKIIRYAIKPADDKHILLRSANPEQYEDLLWRKSYIKTVSKVLGLVRLMGN